MAAALDDGTAERLEGELLIEKRRARIAGHDIDLADVWAAIERATGIVRPQRSINLLGEPVGV